MILCDVNVLVYAFREDAQRHGEYRAWLREQVDKPEAFGVSELALSGFVRVATHPRIFTPPTPVTAALQFADALRSQPNAVSLLPGERHWEIFSRLVIVANAAGNLAADAYHAALAIEQGCEWITTDREFARFPGLRWRHPLG